jgi:hypothetical protein
MALDTMASAGAISILGLAGRLELFVGGRKRQNRVSRAFEHLALRARPCQDADAEQNTQQQLPHIIGGARSVNRAVLLS